MTGDQRPCPEVGTITLGIVRTDDAFFGGRDNFEVDRVVVRRVLDVVLDAPADGGATGGQR